ncbi:hypothetical protein V493_05816 [Pseudogymnoascus sp. VKM F-4281 (FW-2241)]|nr:hypothetical protein V493_05816 [Pseudogymnoascus sp. VKM F-4281 (FW-2241)]
MAPPPSRGLSIPGLPTHGNMMREIAGEEQSPSHKKPITRVQSLTANADKPLAAGRGISCRIQLAEPHVYVFGLKPENRDISSLQFPPAVIRGKLILNVEKATKIKAVTLNFFGEQRTEWPQPIPPDYMRHFDYSRLDYQVLPFFNALLPSDDTGYGAQCKYDLKDKGPTTSSLRIDPALAEALTKVMEGYGGRKQKPVLTAREQKRLSLGSVQSTSVENRQSSGASTRQTGYKIFPPGIYEYSFAITLDHRRPETMNLPFGSVHWRLESLVERHGAFRTNLRGKQEVLVVRAPQVNAEDHLEEPITFTRKYNEVNCHVLIQGGAFPVGGKIPVVFTFTPLEKVEVRAVDISILEKTVYSCKNGLHSKKGEDREIRLFEKRAGHPLSEEFEKVGLRFLHGGELTPEQRADARAQAESMRHNLAAAAGVAPEPLPEDGDNLLGAIDLGLDHFIGQTFNLSFAIFKTGESGVQSKVESTKEFCVKITLLSCLATLARTTLPIYRGVSNLADPTQIAECGCPNATKINTSSLSLLAGFSNITGPILPDPPSEPLDNTTPRIRPIQMLRYPSYGPPPFNADQPPPPIVSPPPNYDTVVGTPSHDGLADYFTRVANVYDEEEGLDESEGESGNESKLRQNTSRSGRVYILNPRSPGSRAPSASMEINRDFMFRQGLLEAIQESQAGTVTMSQPGETRPGATLPGDSTSQA